MHPSRIQIENKRQQDIAYRNDLKAYRANKNRGPPPVLKQIDVVREDRNGLVPPTDERHRYERFIDFINNKPFNLSDVPHIFKRISSKFNTRSSCLIWRYNNHYNRLPQTRTTKIPSRIIINIPHFNKIVFCTNKHIYIISFRRLNNIGVKAFYNIKFDVDADYINEVCKQTLNIDNIFDNIETKITKYIISGPNKYHRKQRLWYLCWFMTKGKIPSYLHDDSIKKRCQSLLPLNNEYKSRKDVRNNTINMLFN
jgi:hypothetical protein